MTHTSCDRAPALLATALLALVAAGCSGASTAGEEAAGPGAAAGYPVTVTSCERETTYAAPPQRAVANDVNLVEMMLALGLQDRMAGVTGVADKGEVRADLRAAFDTVPQLSDKYVELEQLLGADADFLFAGWNYGLSESNNLTPEVLEGHGVQVYELTESCAHVIDGKPAPSVEEVYTDLTNLGAVFGVPDRAARLVAELRGRVEAVRERVRGAEPVPVFVYDSGQEAPFTAPGLAVPNELIALAGGANIFADTPRTWSEVSWEEVVDRNPACVVIVDYDVPWQDKRDFMRSHPAVKEVDAVRDDCFLALPYAALTPGVRNADAVEQIAALLHP